MLKPKFELIFVLINIFRPHVLDAMNHFIDSIDEPIGF